MLGWLRRRRRHIFRYWDGNRTRAIDPLVAWRRMWEDGDCDPQHDFGPATGVGSSGERVDFDQAAQDRVVAMARKMFGLAPFSEDSPGLTVDETLGVLWSFIAFMNELKKKRVPSPTTSPASGSDSSPESSTTPPASDSPSIGSGLKSDEPSSSSRQSYRL